MRSYEKEVEVLLSIAREASAKVMEIYATDFAVEYKSPGDPVTAADRAANDLIGSALVKAFPGAGIVAEESAPSSDDALFSISALPQVWFVDPVDGTREFAAKNGEFCVMIGGVFDGVAEVGVVSVPAEDQLYFAAGGLGCWVEPLSGGQRSPLTLTAPDPENLRAVVSRSHPSPRASEILERIGVATRVRCGSVGVKAARILSGVADLYVHPSSGAKLWDSAAPEALLRAAGGVLTDLHGAPINYRGPLGLDEGIIACHASLHERVLRAQSDR